MVTQYTFLLRSSKTTPYVDITSKTQRDSKVRLAGWFAKFNINNISHLKIQQACVI